MPVTFETTTTRLVPDREICWETIADQIVRHSGRVRFELVPSGCRIDVQLTYRPPAGVIGHSIAQLLNIDPKARLDDDLMRMKGLLETGHTRVHGHRVDGADLNR